MPTPDAPQTNVSEIVQVEETSGFAGTFQNTGINYASPMKVRDGLIVSTVANVFTLGLFKRSMRPTGANMRATWMTINCENKSFDVLPVIGISGKTFIMMRMLELKNYIIKRVSPLALLLITS